MGVRRIETLTWVLIYGGLICMSLGWFITPRQGPWGELMITGGIIATIVGAVLVFVRSKMKP